MFLRFNEATFDPLFGTIEWLWHISKQCNSQPVLIFPDKSLPCLCLYFVLAVMTLYEGLVPGTKAGTRPGEPDHLNG